MTIAVASSAARFSGVIGGGGERPPWNGVLGRDRIRLLLDRPDRVQRLLRRQSSRDDDRPQKTVTQRT